jgi:type I restriction enzyme S subunit
MSEDWVPKQISESCDILDHFRVPINDEIRQTMQGNIPYYGANGIQGYISKYIFDEDLILIAEDGGNFEQYATRPIAYKIKGKSWINNHAHILRAKSGFNQDYIFYSLVNKDILKFIKGGTRSKLNKSELEKIEIIFPVNPSVQNKIAHILCTIDSVIEKTQSAIDKYKAIKQGMLQDLFTRGIDITTGKLRPRYEDAPELYKESKLGWIPNEWDSVEIKNSTHSIMSNVDKHIRENEIEVSLCNYMDVYTNRYLTNQISFSVGSVNAAEYSRFLLQLHDVIITKDSETPDDIAVPSVLIKKIQNLICGYHLCILRSNDLKHLNGEFLMLQLQLPEINRQFAIRANGSTRYGLTIDSIENSYIKIPNEIKEQTEIVLRLHTIDNKLKSEESYLLKLQMLKSGLMSDLLSGRKRVKVAAQE